MPRPSKGPRLGGGPAHERLLLANLATALFTHKAITTTETKAKRLQPLAERLVTFGKRGDLHARRRVQQIIRDKSAVHELFTEIGPLMAERPGGYTRITKTGFRKGDNAPMAVIELVLEPVTPKRSSAKGAPAARAAAAPTAEPVVTEEESTVDEAVGGADSAATDVPVEETDAVEHSESTPAEEPSAAAEEVEADAAEVAEEDAK